MRKGDIGMTRIANATRKTHRTKLVLAIALALGVAIPAAAASSQVSVGQHTSKGSMAAQSQMSLTGPLLVGPVESVSRDGRSIQVLGTRVDLGISVQQPLLAQYVAVSGTMDASGALAAESIRILEDVYAPGSSLVVYAGRATRISSGASFPRIGNVSVNGISIANFDEWLVPRINSPIVVVGTQSIAGAAIDAKLAVAFSYPSILEIESAALETSIGIRARIIAFGIDGTGALGIDGTGALGIDGTGALGIDGTGALGIDGTGALGIDGTGALGIDGTGALGIDGTGALGIDGTGALGIDGTGALGIDGTGALGIDGTGALGIDGTGAP